MGSLSLFPMSGTYPIPPFYEPRMHPRPNVALSVLALLTVFLSSSAVGQISAFPYTQNFDSLTPPELPSEWSSSQNHTPGTNDFTTSPTTPRSLPNAVGSTNATIGQTLTSCPVDFSGKVPDRLSFYTRRSSTHLARVVVEASIDGGGTFPIQVGDTLTNTVPSSYVLSSFTIPDTLSDRNSVKFRWRIIPDASGNTATFRIDDISISVQVMQDLSMTRLSFVPVSPVEGDSVTAVARVMNVGQQTASSFTVQFYEDRNRDSIPQPDELVANVSNLLPLAVADSVDLMGSIGQFRPGDRMVIARVSYALDETPGNNQASVLLRVGYRAGSVVVNEIMYAPVGTEPEWVELFNTNTDSISLKDWLVSDNVVTSRKIISPSTIMIPPAGYVLLTRDSAALIDVHPNIQSRIINVSGFPTLNNSGDQVVLYDNRSATMDSVPYLPGWGGNSGGKSIERVDSRGSSTQQSNWSTSRDAARSTPGQRNSISRKDHDLAVSALVISPALPVRGDSITAMMTVRNPGFVEASGYVLQLFDDANRDSLPQPGEMVHAANQSFPLGPLDSLTFSFPPFHPTRNEHILIGVVAYAGDEDSSNNAMWVRSEIGHRKGSVVISEIMYSPVNEPEWVELANITGDTVDMRGWKVSNRFANNRYGITTESIFFPPGGLIVITKDTALLAQRYGCLWSRVLQVPSLPTFLFNNSGDAVVVLDNAGLQMDSVKFVSTWGGEGGASLERIDLLDASNDSVNWASSMDSMRATPGKENSIATLDHDLKVMKPLEQIVLPGVPVPLGVTVKNIGRRPASGFEVAFFDDSNRDSSATVDELIARVHVLQALSRGETLHVTTPWSAPLPGIHRVMATTEYAPDMRPGNNITSFVVKIGYGSGTVVINEIMYAPLTNEAEYVELVNNSSQRVDLSGWKISDRPETSGSSNECSLGTRRRPLQPGECFVIASDSSVFKRFRNLDTMDNGRIVIANHSGLGFNNEGDAVILQDAVGSTIDSVAYTPSWHNPNVADQTGRSLEKIAPWLRSNDARSWSTCVLGIGGTPGATNSIFTAGLPVQARVSCSPNPFSPDGDGVEDFSIIHYELPTEVATVSVRLYDVKGRLIRHLVNSEPSGMKREVVWDGLDEERQKARVGIYVILVEGLNQIGGNVYSAKGVVVLAAKL